MEGPVVGGAQRRHPAGAVLAGFRALLLGDLHPAPFPCSGDAQRRCAYPPSSSAELPPLSRVLSRGHQGAGVARGFHRRHLPGRGDPRHCLRYQEGRSVGGQVRNILFTECLDSVLTSLV